MSLGAETILLDSLSADPVSPVAGELWFNQTAGELRGFDGSAVVTLASAPDAPAPYDPGVLVIADGHFAIRVDPAITGSNSITIEGDGQLVIH